MANLTEYTILNGIDNDLRESIEFVGGDTSSAVGVVDLAGIIKSQLITNKAIGEGVYDQWMFGSPDTNYIYEPVTESTNAVQAKVIAASIKEVYELMKNIHKPLIYVVDQLPETEKSLSALYMLRHSGEEENTVRKSIDLSGDIITMPEHKGTVKYENNIIKITPNNNGEVNAIFGWDLNYKMDDYDCLTIRTNILAWGDTGVKYSLNGTDFFPIKSDTIILTRDELKEMGVDRISKFLFYTDSVNTKYNYTEILIREMYLEKIEKYSTSYSLHHYIKEGQDIKQVDCGQLKVDFNQLFYIAREEFADNVSKINNYIDALENTLRRQFGSFLSEGSITIEEMINNLTDRCNKIDERLSKCVSIDDIATQEFAGLMSPIDKTKLDSIGAISDEYLNNLLKI
jgi:hypothetical protein